MSTNDSAIDDTAERFLCNDHPRPDLLELMYRTLHEKREIKNYEDLASYLGTSKDKMPSHVLDILNIAYRDGDLLVAEELPEDIQALDNCLQFKAFLLNRIASRTRNGREFSKQAHFLLIYEWALSNSKKIIDYKKSADVNSINQYFKERNYVPYSLSSVGKRPILMNENKLHFWTILATYLGLIRPGPSGNKNLAIVYLNDRMMLAFIRLHLSREGGISPDHGDTCFLTSFVRWTEDNFILIPETENGTLPTAVSSCLLRLEDSSSIKLVVVGDKRSYIFPSSLGSDILSRKANAIEVML